MLSVDASCISDIKGVIYSTKCSSTPRRNELTVANSLIMLQWLILTVDTSDRHARPHHVRAEGARDSTDANRAD